MPGNIVTAGTAVTVAAIEATKCAQGKTNFMETSKKMGRKQVLQLDLLQVVFQELLLEGAAGASLGPVGAVVGTAAGGAYGAYVGDVVGSYMGELAGTGIGYIGELFK